MLSIVAALAGAPAEARNYGTPVDVSTEDDLRILFEDGVLSEADFNTLLELLNNPVNVNNATRNELFDLPMLTIWQCQQIVMSRTQERYETLDDLRRVQGIDSEVIAQIRSYAWTGPGPDQVDTPHGKVRVRAAMILEEDEVLEPDDNPNGSHSIEQIDPRYTDLPKAYLTAQVRYQKWLEVGFVGLAQEDLANVYYDPERRDFIGSWGTPVFELGRAYAKFKRGAGSLIVGHYAAGFGLGLTFDRTNRTHPNGFYTDMAVNGASAIDQQNYSVPRRLFGVATNIQVPDLNGKRLDTTFFASSTRYDLYQYDLALAGGEPLDPLEEDELTSARIYVDGYKVNYLTLPNAYRESLGGFNLTLGLGPRSEIGGTTWLGHMDRTTIPGVEDPYEFILRDSYPSVDTYGAAGVYASGGSGPVDVFAEGAVTFTGGWGALAKAIWTPVKRSEIEVSARHYSTDFDNPHARGLAAADQYAGMRDRDEQGGRLKATYDVTPWLNVRFTGDVWRNLSTDLTNLDVYARAQVEPGDAFRVSVFGDHINQNVALNGRAQIYGGEYDELDAIESDLDEDVATSGADRSGARSLYGSQLDVYSVPQTTLSAFYRRSYTDSGLLYPTGDGPCEYWYQIGHYAWFKAKVDLFEKTSLTARVRYRDDDVHGSLEDRFVEGYLQWTQKLPRRVKISTRGTLGRDLYDPAAEWKDDCARAGIPELEGSCVAATDDAEDVVHDKPYGLVWVSAEVRF